MNLKITSEQKLMKSVANDENRYLLSVAICCLNSLLMTDPDKAVKLYGTHLIEEVKRINSQN